jgi:hypothetical protein
VNRRLEIRREAEVRALHFFACAIYLIFVWSGKGFTSGPRFLSLRVGNSNSAFDIFLLVDKSLLRNKSLNFAVIEPTKELTPVLDCHGCQQQCGNGAFQ